MTLNDSKEYNVLLVEDNPADAERMEFLLEEEDSIVFNIKTVLRMREAILELRERTFDLILLDISLPDSVGIETLKKIQETSSTIPIIVISGLDEEKLAQKCIEAGAKDYVLKEQTNPNKTLKTIGYSLLKEKHSNVAELEKIIAHYKELSTIGATTTITATLSGSGAIKERYGDTYTELTDEYSSLLTLYLDQLVTAKEKPHIEMKKIITQIGDFGGGPRDLLDVHLGALDHLVEGEDASRGQSFVVEGRLLALEMMGLLVDYYRVGQRQRFM